MLPNALLPLVWELSNENPERKPIMKYAITGAAMAAALTLTGFSAHASCADPRTAAESSPVHANRLAAVQQASADDTDNDGGGYRRIVGTWHVSYTVEGNPFADAFIQWHGDGNSYIGTNEQKIFDLNGNMLADVTGTSAATRLWPNC
jgi:hypothetical protein